MSEPLHAGESASYDVSGNSSPDGNDAIGSRFSSNVSRQGVAGLGLPLQTARRRGERETTDPILFSSLCSWRARRTIFAPPPGIRAGQPAAPPHKRRPRRRNRRIAPEVSPVGGHPDTQAFIKYSPRRAATSSDVPEGWAVRRMAGGHVREQIDGSK